MISTTAKFAWLFLGAAKVCGIFAVFCLILNELKSVKIFLIFWIILLIISVILALRSKKYELEIKEWWRYYLY